MTFYKNRRAKLLKTIAQTTSATTSTDAISTQGTPVSTPTPAKPSIDLTGIFSQIALPVGWDTSRIPYISRILSKLDIATNVATNGKYNLRALWPTFPSGAESEFTPPAQDVLSLLRKVFVAFLNKGTPYTKPLSSEEVSQRINVLLQAPELSKLEQINPTSPLGQANISLASIRQDLMSINP
jgi:hypothetical protein